MREPVLPPLGLIDRLLEPGPSVIGYDTRGIRRELDLLDGHLAAAFGGRRRRLLYSVKANGYPGLLEWLARQGLGGSVASRAEAQAAAEAGMTPVYATAPGFGGADVRAMADSGVLVDADNTAQLAALPQGSEVGIRLRVPLEPDTTVRGEGFSRFGLHPSDPEVKALIADGAYTVRRLHGHFRDIGSPQDLVSLAMLVAEAAGALPDLAEVNLGGGMTRLYRHEEQATEAWMRCAQALGVLPPSVGLAVEPGAQVTTAHGYLRTTVMSWHERASGRRLAVVDASKWRLVAWSRLSLVACSAPQGDLVPTDVVGPTCYENDVWVTGLPLPPLPEGARLVFRGVGAYVMSMSKRMHGLPDPAEFLA